MSKKTKIIVGAGILAIIITAGYFIFFRKSGPKYILTKAEMANVVQEVTESGTVKVGDEINLSFKSQGKIINIYVKAGDQVKAGQSLVQLDNAQLGQQLRQAQAALQVAQANLNKLLAGATPEEIKVYEAEVNAKQVALETAKENLNQAYDDSLNTLDSAYLKIYSAFTAVDLIQRTYFNAGDQESLRVKENKTKIENAMTQAKSYLDAAKSNPNSQNIDVALSQMKTSLGVVSDALAVIREACEQSTYKTTVSSADKTTLDTQRTNINTALTNVVAAQQDIDSAGLAENTAQAALDKAKDQLNELKAPARQEDIDLYRSQVAQAQAAADVLKVQVQETTIFSPTAGQITQVEKRAGETVQPSVTVISMLPQSPFQVSVDIYEEDIVKVKIDNPVDIKLTAFPDKIFQGKVIAIDPSEKIVDGVVYYEVTIDFQETVLEMKPGMTADITIKTAAKDNVLTILKSTIQQQDSKTMVQVYKDEKIEERQIQIGLEGSNDLVEVVSGLQAGEEVILP